MQLLVNTTFLTASLAKINLIPRHVWEPVLKDLASKPETAEQLKDVSRIGSGPFRLVRWKPTEEILLERFGEHFAAPKVERWIMRIVPNVKRLGLLSPWLRERFTELGILGFEDMPADA